MAELGVFDAPPQKWFPFDEDTEVLLEFQGRKALIEIEEKAEKQARLTKGNFKNYQNKILGKRAVKGWRKITDHNHPGLILKGQPFPYSEENCAMLMLNSTEFSNFVNSNCSDSKAFLGEEGAEEEGPDASKNA